MQRGGRSPSDATEIYGVGFLLINCARATDADPRPGSDTRRRRSPMKRLGFVAAVMLVLAGMESTLPAAGPVPSGSSVVVYLVRGEHVAPVRRVVVRTAAPARASLTALLAGPTATERRLGYTTAIPAPTRLRSVSLSDRVLTVDLSSRFAAGGGSASMLLRVAQLVYTATAFPSVDRVAFRLDGKPVGAIGGEGVVVRPPVNRSTFEAEAPAILVEQPLPGDRVSTRLRIRGSANVFEAQFEIDVVTPSGARLAHRAVLASAGTGTRGGFDVTIPLASAARRLVVVAYDRSAKDGARIDLVRVPVTLR